MTEVTFRSDVRVELIDFVGGDERVVQAARVSTKGAGSLGAQAGGEGLIRYLMRDRHMVPFEHSVFTFYVDAPIFVTRQLLKHRISSISETSGRYKELVPEFYIPGEGRPVVQVGKTGDYQFQDDVVRLAFARTEIELNAKCAWTSYEAMLRFGIAKEMARTVLPTSIYSPLYISVNAVSLMNILRLRTSDWGSHPQYEIELMAKQMLEIFQEKMPVTADAFLATRPPELWENKDANARSVAWLEYLFGQVRGWFSRG